MHDHPHGTHAHDHRHAHGLHIHPAQDHVAGGIAATIVPATPAFSLVTLGAGARVAVAVLLVAALWSVTSWAIAP